MDFITLDENFQRCGPTKLAPFDIMWHRKYYENGQFSLQIDKGSYSADMEYVYTSERNEVGIIQQRKFTQDDNMVVLSGFFLESVLGRKCVYPMMTQTSTRMQFIADAIENYPVDGFDIVVDGFTESGTASKRQETGGQLDEVAHTMLKAEEMAYRCYWGMLDHKVHVQFYKGADRTQSQNVNNFVTFSPKWRNMKGATATLDDSNYANYFVAGGQGEGADRVYVVIDLSDGGVKVEKFLDMRDVEYNTEEMTLEEYKAVLRGKAAERALNYVKIKNIEFDADATRSFQYLEDYDLGDKCDIVIDDLGLSYQARIIEVIETWVRNEYRVTLVFGDKIPTPYEKVRLR